MFNYYICLFSSSINVLFIEHTSFFMNICPFAAIASKKKIEKHKIRCFCSTSPYLKIKIADLWSLSAWKVTYSQMVYHNFYNFFNCKSFSS